MKEPMKAGMVYEGQAIIFEYKIGTNVAYFTIFVFFLCLVFMITKKAKDYFFKKR